MSVRTLIKIRDQTFYVTCSIKAAWYVLTFLKSMKELSQVPFQALAAAATLLSIPKNIIKKFISLCKHNIDGAI